MWMKELFFNPPFQFLRSSVLGISFTEGAGGAGREGGRENGREGSSDGMEGTNGYSLYAGPFSLSFGLGVDWHRSIMPSTR